MPGKTFCLLEFPHILKLFLLKDFSCDPEQQCCRFDLRNANWSTPLTQAQSADQVGGLQLPQDGASVPAAVLSGGQV